MHRLCDHTGIILKFFLLSNGHLASLSWNRIATVWNVENGQRLKTFALDVSLPRRPKIALSNELFAAKVLNSIPQNISVFNSNTGELVKSLIGHENDVHSLVLLNDTHMASSSWDHTIKIWHLTSGHAVRTLPGSINGSRVEIALLLDDVLACFSYSYGSSTLIQLWKWKTGELWKTIESTESNRKYLFFEKTLTKSPDKQQRLICFFDYPFSIEILNVI
jgi:WD40 repeat protein